MLRTLSLAWLILLPLVVVPLPARAEGQRARHTLFERAQGHLRNEQWDKARELLEILWRERKTHDVALQLGQAEYQLNRFREAAEHLAFGLATLPPREPLQTAIRSKQLLALCQQEVGTLGLQIENGGAEVVVDGSVVGTAPLLTELFLEPGAHALEVRLVGHQSATLPLQLVAGQLQHRKVKLLPLTAPIGDGPRTEPLPRANAGTDHRASYAPVVAGGILAVAGISTGIAMQLLRNSTETELNGLRRRVGTRGCVPPPTADPKQCANLVELSADYDSFGRIELLSFLIGGTALLATGAYFFVTRPDRPKQNARLRYAPFNVDATLSPQQTQLRFTLDF